MEIYNYMSCTYINDADRELKDESTLKEIIMLTGGINASFSSIQDQTQQYNLIISAN